ncbi:uncharacterized protein MEPE_05513 [Melanopsichium pennsylvanicum]|uniref:Uncharacterized protein n=1 Tax=Melanopsichium pennsylvanicum TaxID=63383 RepID=A0AAJ5C7S8_9BASI|nr:uncharacterized protein MEPE_05513 [Melanopsichium pennsylvanicum]
MAPSTAAHAPGSCPSRCLSQLSNNKDAVKSTATKDAVERRCTNSLDEGRDAQNAREEGSRLAGVMQSDWFFGCLLHNTPIIIVTAIEGSEGLTVVQSWRILAGRRVSKIYSTATFRERQDSGRLLPTCESSALVPTFYQSNPKTETNISSLKQYTSTRSGLNLASRWSL